MNKIKLKMRNYMAIFPTIKIDGKIFKPKLNRKTKLYEVDFETEKNVVNLHLYKWYELSEKNWVIMSFINWIISFFGLFSAGYEKNCQTFDTSININLTGQNTEIALNFNNPRQNIDAFQLFINDAQYFIENNKYQVDLKAKKRRKIVKVVSFFGFIIIAIAVIILLIKFI